MTHSSSSVFNVDFGDDRRGAEINITGRLSRNTYGPKWLPQIGYVHFFYAPADVSPDYGEAFAKTDYTSVRTINIPFVRSSSCS